MLNKYIKNKYESEEPSSNFYGGQEEKTSIATCAICLVLVVFVTFICIGIIGMSKKLFEPYAVSPAGMAMNVHNKSDSTIDHSSGYALAQTEYDIPQNSLNEIYTPVDYE